MPPRRAAAAAAKKMASTSKQQRAANSESEAPASESGELAEQKKAYKATNPTTYEEFSEAQRYLYDERKAGKSWEELNPGWERITGEKPGRDVLRKRYAKLAAIATEWTSEDERKLCEVKKDVDKEIAFYVELIEKQAWDRVTAKLEGDGIRDIKAAAVQARYEKLEKEGKIGEDGLLMKPRPKIKLRAKARSPVAEGSSSGIQEGETVEEERGLKKKRRAKGKGKGKVSGETSGGGVETSGGVGGDANVGEKYGESEVDGEDE